jgi:hypothetical protein
VVVVIVPDDVVVAAIASIIVVTTVANRQRTTYLNKVFHLAIGVALACCVAVLPSLPIPEVALQW